MTDRLTVEEARVALVNGRDEDLQQNMDALIAARDAEWRAAVLAEVRKVVERQMERYQGCRTEHDAGILSGLEMSLAALTALEATDA